MILGAIEACEVGFWLVLAAGLLARYGLRRPTLGAVLLACVPLVDLALLALTVVDLRRGAEPEAAHGLAAVYLGVTVVFGHAAVSRADLWAAHRWAGGPPPEARPASGTPARVRREWRGFSQGCLAVGTSAGLLVAASALAGPQPGADELLAWLPRLGLVLLVWLVGWPVWETLRLAFAPPRRSAT